MSQQTHEEDKVGAFTEISLVDTSGDYRVLNDREHALMQGERKAKMAGALGNGGHEHFLENWRTMTVGELRTGRIRARKPGAWRMPRRRAFGCSAQGHALVLVAVLATGAIALSSDGRVTWAGAAQDTSAPAQVTPGVDCSACTLRHKALLKRRKPTESCRIKGEIGDAGALIYHLPGGDPGRGRASDHPGDQGGVARIRRQFNPRVLSAPEKWRPARLQAGARLRGRSGRGARLRRETQGAVQGAVTLQHRR